MTQMFEGCPVEYLDLKKFNTKKVKNMLGIFNRCTQLRSIDLSNFDKRN